MGRPGVISNLSWTCLVGRWTPGLQVEEKEGDGEGGATDTGVGASLALGRAREGRTWLWAGPGRGWVHPDRSRLPQLELGRALGGWEDVGL